MNWITKQIKILISFLVLLLFGGGLMYYAYKVEPTYLFTKEYRIKNKNITESFDGFKIVHFSDLHYGYYYGKDDLMKVVEQINKQNADLIIFSGDLFDNFANMNKSDIDDVTEVLSLLDAKYGMYAIYGNHDFYNKSGNVDYYEKILTDSGFTLLRNEMDTLSLNKDEFIQIVGFDDLLHGSPEFDTSLLSDAYTIGLVHEPDYADELNLNKYDLILSGHSHGGQIALPFYGGVIHPPGAQTYNKEYHDLGQADLYISQGIGRTRVPFRLFSSPKIYLYRLGKE